MYLRCALSMPHNLKCDLLMCNLTDSCVQNLTHSPGLVLEEADKGPAHPVCRGSEATVSSTELHEALLCAGPGTISPLIRTAGRNQKRRSPPSNLDWRVAVVIALVQSMGTVVWGPDRGEAVSLVRQD